jgi:hypothetical protein
MMIDIEAESILLEEVESDQLQKEIEMIAIE